jgi:hypothetical protein
VIVSWRDQERERKRQKKYPVLGIFEKASPQLPIRYAPETASARDSISGQALSSRRGSLSSGVIYYSGPIEEEKDVSEWGIVVSVDDGDGIDRI